jgi:acetyl esterase
MLGVTSRGKYDALLDAETWAFIERTNSFYPPETIDFDIGKQREVYNSLCRVFHAGYPDGVSASDSVIPAQGRDIPVRRYHLEGGNRIAQVVYYHGGGFVVGGLESHDDVCAEICARTGFDVTSVDYRLAPEYRFPDDFDDALAAFDSIAADGVPVVAVGDSAGGNLAAAVSHASRGKGHVPTGQVLIYPGLGSRLDQGSFLEHADAPMLTQKDTKFYKAIRTRGDNKLFENPHCAPLNDSDFSALPPTLVVSAECDPLSDDGRDYCARINEAGGRAVWFNEAGLVHGYLRARHSVGRARASFTRIVDGIGSLGRGEWPY